MNIKIFSKIIFNFVIIIITLFIATTIVNAEDIISTSIDKQTNITQSTKTAITESTNLTKSVKPQSEETINNDIKTTTNENEQEDSIQQKQEQTTITQSPKEISTQAMAKKNYQYVRFFINCKLEALDAGGNVGGQYPDQFTPMLWECDVKNATADTNYYIVGETKDNSYKADKEIRKLVGDKKDGSIYIVSFPTDEYIFKELKKYVNILSIDGKSIKVDELNTDHYGVFYIGNTNTESKVYMDNVTLVSDFENKPGVLSSNYNYKDTYLYVSNTAFPGPIRVDGTRANSQNPTTKGHLYVGKNVTYSGITTGSGSTTGIVDTTTYENKEFLND